jgi:hypothetical protein
MICLLIPSSLKRELDDLIAPGAGEGGQVAAFTGHTGEPLRRPVSIPQPKRDLPSELALCVAGLETKDALVLELLASATVEAGRGGGPGTEGQQEGNGHKQGAGSQEAHRDAKPRRRM